MTRLMQHLVAMILIVSLGGVGIQPVHGVPKAFPVTRTNKDGVLFPRSYKRSRDGATLEVHEMTENESIKRFDGRKFSNRLASNGIIPLSITVTNNSTVPLRLSDKHVGLVQISNRELAKKSIIPIWVPEQTASIVGAVPAWIGAQFMVIGIVATVLGNIAGGVFFCLSGYALAVAPRRLGKRGRRAIERKNAEKSERWGSAALDTIRISPGESRTAIVFVRNKHMFKDFSVGIFKGTQPQRRLDFGVQL